MKTCERYVLKDALNENSVRERLTPSEIARKYTIIQGATNVSKIFRHFHKLIHDNMVNTQQSYLHVVVRVYKSISVKSDDDVQ